MQPEQVQATPTQVPTNQCLENSITVLKDLSAKIRPEFLKTSLKFLSLTDKN